MKRRVLAWVLSVVTFMSTFSGTGFNVSAEELEGLEQQIVEDSTEVAELGTTTYFDLDVYGASYHNEDGYTVDAYTKAYINLSCNGVEDENTYEGSDDSNSYTSKYSWNNNGESNKALQVGTSIAIKYDLKSNIDIAKVYLGGDVNGRPELTLGEDGFYRITVTEDLLSSNYYNARPYIDVYTYTSIDTPVYFASDDIDVYAYSDATYTTPITADTIPADSKEHRYRYKAKAGKALEHITKFCKGSNWSIVRIIHDSQTSSSEGTFTVRIGYGSSSAYMVPNLKVILDGKDDKNSDVFINGGSIPEGVKLIPNSGFVDSSVFATEGKGRINANTSFGFYIETSQDVIPYINYRYGENGKTATKIANPDNSFFVYDEADDTKVIGRQSYFSLDGNESDIYIDIILATTAKISVKCIGTDGTPQCLYAYNIDDDGSFDWNGRIYAEEPYSIYLPVGQKIRFSTDDGYGLFSDADCTTPVQDAVQISGDLNLYIKPIGHTLLIQTPLANEGIEDILMYDTSGILESTITKDGDYEFSYAGDFNDLKLLVKPSEDYDLFYYYYATSNCYTYTYMKDPVIKSSSIYPGYPSGYYVLDFSGSEYNYNYYYISQCSKIKLETYRKLNATVDSTINGVSGSVNFGFIVYDGWWNVTKPQISSEKPTIDSEEGISGNEQSFYYGRTTTFFVGSSVTQEIMPAVFYDDENNQYTLEHIYMTNPSGYKTDIIDSVRAGLDGYTLSITAYTDVQFQLDFAPISNSISERQVKFHVAEGITGLDVYLIDQSVDTYTNHYYQGSSYRPSLTYSKKYESVEEEGKTSITVDKKYDIFLTADSVPSGKTITATVVLDDGRSSEIRIDPDSDLNGYIYTYYSASKYKIQSDDIDIYIDLIDTRCNVTIESDTLVDYGAISLYTVADNSDGDGIVEISGAVDVENKTISVPGGKVVAISYQNDTTGIRPVITGKEIISQTYDNTPIYFLGKICGATTLELKMLPVYNITYDGVDDVAFTTESDSYFNGTTLRSDATTIYYSSTWNERLKCTTEGFSLEYKGKSESMDPDTSSIEDLYILKADSNQITDAITAHIALADAQADHRITVTYDDTYTTAIGQAIHWETDGRINVGQKSINGSTCSYLTHDDVTDEDYFIWKWKYKNALWVQTIPGREPVVTVTDGESNTYSLNYKDLDDYGGNIYVYAFGNVTSDLRVDVTYKKVPLWGSLSSECMGNISFETTNAILWDIDNDVLLKMGTRMAGYIDPDTVDLDQIEEVYYRETGTTVNFSVEPLMGYEVNKVTREVGKKAEIINPNEDGTYSVKVDPYTTVKVYTVASINDQVPIVIDYPTGLVKVKVDGESYNKGKTYVNPDGVVGLTFEVLDSTMEVSGAWINGIRIPYDEEREQYIIDLADGKLQTYWFSDVTPFDGQIPVSVKLGVHVDETYKASVIESVGTKVVVDSFVSALGDIKLPAHWAWEDADSEIAFTGNIQYFEAYYNGGAGKSFYAQLPVAVCHVSGVEIDASAFADKNANVAFEADVILDKPDGNFDLSQAFPEGTIAYAWSTDTNSTLTINSPTTEITNINTGSAPGTQKVYLKVTIAGRDYTDEKTVVVLETEDTIDYKPILENNKITIHKDSDGVILSLLCQNGNMIRSAQLFESNEVSANFESYTDSDGNIGIKFKEGTTYTAQTKAKTYKVKLKLITDKDSVEYDLSVKVDVAKLSTTFKQTSKVNLFYTDTTATYTVSSKNVITSIQETPGEVAANNRFEVAFDPETSVVTVTPIGITAENYNDYKNNTISLDITYEGYNATVTQIVKVNTENKKPALVMPVTLVTGSLKDVNSYIYFKATNEVVDVEKAVALDFAKDYAGLTKTGIDASTGAIKLNYIGNKAVSYKMNVRLQNWTQIISVSSKVNVVAAPELVLGTSTLTMNSFSMRNSVVYEIPVSVKGSELQADIDAIEGKDAKSKSLITDGKLVVTYDGANHVIKVYGPDPTKEIVPGVYSYKLDGKIADGGDGIATKVYTFKVKVLAKDTTVKFKTKGALNPVELNSGISYTVTTGNSSAAITNIEQTQASEFALDYNGSNGFTLTKFSDDTSLISGQKYTIPIRITLEDGEQINSSVTIKPTIKWPTIKASATSGTVYRGCEKTLTSNIIVSAKTGLRYELSGITVVPDTKKNTHEYFNVSYKDGTVYVSLKPECNKIKAGSYAVNYTVHMVGEDGIVKNKTLKMTVKVK